MPHEAKLSAVLGDFARTMLTDFPIQSILDHLVECIVEILPVDAAGVTLISPGMAPRYVAASDDAAMRFELLQTELGQGPCVMAYESGEEVTVPDLSEETRFPDFTPRALESGMGAVFTFPLRHGDGQLGSLDLFRRAIGSLSPDNVTAAQTLADVVAAYVLNAQSREDARRLTDRFQHTSLHDSLTGLPNRALLDQRLAHAAQRARRSHATVAVLFVDLDRFKRVNDEHGHEVGDQLLRAVGHRLHGLVRPGDTLARVSGDEFVFFCEDLTEAKDIEGLAARVDAAFVEPFPVRKGSLSITASVGLAFAGPGEEVSDQLIVNADIAMYQAKRRGGDAHAIIDLREAMLSKDRFHLATDLANALAGDRLDVAYQPIVRTSDGLIMGVEALLRWNDPLGEPIPPALMVELAEQNGMILELGAWVLERSCRDLQVWRREHADSRLTLAVNVSPRQLMAPDFTEMVTDVLERIGFDPTALTLEMTESIFIEDSQRTMNVLNALKALGGRLALDDFGTGYSSLSYLEQFPVDIVKIDQSFIANLNMRPGGSSLMPAAITHLAHRLGLGVIAEGVETAAQRNEMVAIGCEMSQGYYYARPMPREGLAALLEAGRGCRLRLPAVYVH